MGYPTHGSFLFHSQFTHPSNFNSVFSFSSLPVNAPVHPLNKHAFIGTFTKKYEIMCTYAEENVLMKEVVFKIVMLNI